MDIDKFPEYVGYGAAVLAGAHALYLVAGTYLQETGRKIASQEELEKTVREEAEILGINREKTGIPIISNYKQTDAAKASVFGAEIVDGEIRMHPVEEVNGDRILLMREVELGGRSATKKMVRHELYHLKYHLHKERKSDSNRTFGEKALDTLKYIFIDEPEAIFYGLTGKELHR